MSQRVEQIFASYLARAGRLEEIPLGDDEGEVEAPVTITQKESDEFSSRFAAQQKLQSTMIVVHLVMLCAIFIVGIVGAILLLRLPGLSGGVLGGTLALLLAVVARLHRIWIDKAMIDLAGSIVRDLPPEEAVRLIEVIYWNAVRRRSKAVVERTQLRS